MGNGIGGNFDRNNNGSTIVGMDIQCFIDSLPFYVMLIDEKHIILQTNKAVETVMSISAKDIIGTYCTKIIHNCDGPFPGCPLEEIVGKKDVQYIGREVYDEHHKRWFNSVVYRTNLHSGEGCEVFIHMTHDITDKKQAQDDLRSSLAKLEKTITCTLEAMAKIVDMKDPYTAGHQQRVAALAIAIAEELSYSADKIKGIHYAGLIHDIGKLEVPSELLAKTRRLNDIEFAMIKTHATSGYEILKDIECPWPIADIVHQHHERMDGSGYPLGLSGEAIRPESRIIAIADVVEAMASHRPYRAALGIDKALEEIIKNKGRLYESAAVNACVKLFTEKGFKFEEIN